MKMYPFGEPWYETGVASKWKLTSYERDAELLNDYATFRSYVHRLGRYVEFYNRERAHQGYRTQGCTP